MPLKGFEQNLGRARHLVDLELSVGSITTSAVDLSDLLRAALVLGVSALDHFIHEYVKKEMLEIQKGSRPPTPRYDAFVVPLRAVNSALASGGSSVWLEEAIREAHGWQSFQHPKKIKSAMKLISTKVLWQEVADEMDTGAASITSRLTAIVERRNKIAHESDMDPTYPGTQWPINEPLVTDALNFLNVVTRAINARV